MKQLIERLRYPVICTLDDRIEAADALERMTELAYHQVQKISGQAIQIEVLTAERDALRADAMRYRFIFAESDRVDPVCAVVWKKGNVRNSSEWVSSVGGEWLSKELDAAIAGEKI